MPKGSLGGAGNLHFRHRPLFLGSSRAGLPHPLQFLNFVLNVIIYLYSSRFRAKLRVGGSGLAATTRLPPLHAVLAHHREPLTPFTSSVERGAYTLSCHLLELKEGQPAQPLGGSGAKQPPAIT